MYVCVFVSVCDIVSTAVCTRLPSSFPRAPRASIFRVCNGSTQMRSWRQHTDAWTLNVNKRCGTNLQQGPVTNDDQYRKVLHQEDKDNDPWLQFRVRHPARGKCVSTSRANYAGQRAGRHDDDDKSLGPFVSGWDPPVAMPTDEARRAALRDAGAVSAVATSSSASSAPPPGHRPLVPMRRLLHRCETALVRRRRRRRSERRRRRRRRRQPLQRWQRPRLRAGIH